MLDLKYAPNLISLSWLELKYLASTKKNVYFNKNLFAAPYMKEHPMYTEYFLCILCAYLDQIWHV